MIILSLKKKINWGYIRFWAFVLSILLLSAHSSAFERPQHKFNFHVDSATISGAGVSGFGISYDYVDKKGNAFALEQHSLTLSSITYLGYRYHANNGFFTGLGYAQTEQKGILFECPASIISDVLCIATLTTQGLAFSVGYTHVFKSGFSLGLSALAAPASSQNFGLVAGYTWR